MDGHYCLNIMNKILHYQNTQFQIELQNRRNRDRIDTLNIYMHDHSLSWLGTDTSIKSDDIKLV